MKKTKETSRQIYITVVTSSLTMLVNKVARRLQPNEDIFDACSELANDIAKKNGLEWSNVLMNYYNHYSDEIPQFDNWRIPSKPNQKQFDESLFKAYINKFSNEDKIKALNILVCSISTTDNKFNSLLNQISNRYVQVFETELSYTISI